MRAINKQMREEDLEEENEPGRTFEQEKGDPQIQSEKRKGDESQEGFQAACFRWQEEWSVAPRWEEEEAVFFPLDLFCQARTVYQTLSCTSCRLAQEVATALIELDIEGTGLPPLKSVWTMLLPQRRHWLVIIITLV